MLQAVRQHRLEFIERRLAAEAAKQAEKAVVREHEAMKAAAPELQPLDRYERRAWSRLKRAMREFIELKYEYAQAATT